MSVVDLHAEAAGQSTSQKGLVICHCWLSFPGPLEALDIPEVSRLWPADLQTKWSSAPSSEPDVKVGLKEQTLVCELCEMEWFGSSRPPETLTV